MNKTLIEKYYYEILSDITGQNSNELKEYKDINALESGILDSLSIIDLFIRFQIKTNIQLSFTDFKTDDFKSLSTLLDAIILKVFE